MAIISFENIAPDGGNVIVPDGFRKLDWDDFFAVDDGVLREEVGNTNAIRTGEAAGFTNDSPESHGFKSFNRGDDFDLNNGYFTTYNTIDLTVKVFGFDDGERVAKKVLTLDTDREFVRFGSQFDDIDEVRFTVSGGTDADPSDSIPAQQSFGVDDLFLNF